MEEENKNQIECSGCGCKLEIPKDNAVKGIGTHFIKCEYCGTFNDTGKKEWLELEEGERSSLLSKGAFIKSFLVVAISEALIASIAKASGYIVTVGVFILIICQIVLYYVFKSANISKLSVAVRESLKRTEDEKYLALLKEKGITIYPLTKKEKEKYIDYEFIKKEPEETEEDLSEFKKYGFIDENFEEKKGFLTSDSVILSDESSDSANSADNSDGGQYDK